MRNVKTIRVADKSVLDAPATLLTADAKVTGQLTGPESSVAYVINHNTDNTLATLRFKLKDVKMSAAEDSFKIGEQQFNCRLVHFEEGRQSAGFKVATVVGCY